MSCPDCFRGAVHDGTPVGTEKSIAGVRTYIAGKSESQDASAVIFITDAFGFNLVNNKLLADIYALKTGLKVLVPDIIPGGGVPVDTLALMESATTPVKWWNIFGHIRKVITVLRMMSRFIPFARRTKNIFPSILSYARGVRAELPTGTKLGAAGFCWGALQTTKLAQEPAIEGGKEKLLDAHFMAHPAGLKVPEDIISAITTYEVPCSIAIGDRDMVLSKEKVENLEASLRMELTDTKQYPYELKMYTGCGHGFAVRADPKKTVEDEAAEQAVDQAVSWFKQYLA
jgi:dienelactone hydrolase